MPPIEIGRVILKSALARATQGQEGARYIGAAISNVTGTSVQTILESLKTLIDSKVDPTDPRLSDARTPTTHAHSGEDITRGTLSQDRLGTSGTRDANNFYRGDGVFATPPAAQGAADSSTTTKGIGRISAAPTDPATPIFVGDNDTRNSNARTPTAHAHPIADVPVAADGVSDATRLTRSDDSRITPATTTKAGLQSAADKTKVDGQSTAARELVMIVGTGTTIFNNVSFAANGSIVSADVRGMTNIPLDAKGIIWQLGAGADGSTIFPDSADAANQAASAHRYSKHAGAFFSHLFFTPLGTGANAGKVKLSSATAQSGLFGIVHGYWR